MIQFEEFLDGFSVRTRELGEEGYLKKADGWDRKKVEQVKDLLSNRAVASAAFSDLKLKHHVGSYEFKL